MASFADIKDAAFIESNENFAKNFESAENFALCVGFFLANIELFHSEYSPLKRMYAGKVTFFPTVVVLTKKTLVTTKNLLWSSIFGFPAMFLICS